VQGVAEVSSKCQCNKEKGTVTEAKSLLVGGLEIFRKKIFAQRKCPDNLFYINESFQKICLVFKALSTKRKEKRNNHNSGFIFPVGKNTCHFRLISYTGLNLHTQTNNNHTKKNIHTCLGL